MRLSLDQGYDGIKISRNAWDSTMSSVNTKFLAVVLEAQGGGAFMVIPLESVSVASPLPAAIVLALGVERACAKKGRT